MPGKTLPFRLYVQILIFSGLVILGALILWPFQRAVQGGMISIRDDLITRLEQRIDRKIRYSSISPSLFGSFDVRNVRVIDQDDRPVLTMSRFRIAYSLWDLLRGKVRAIHSVRIDSPFIDFNTARDRDLISLFEKLSAGEDSSRQNFDGIFPESLMVRIRNGKFLVHKSGDQFEIDALNLDIEIGDNRVIFGGKWVFGVTVDWLIGAPVNLYAAVRANGSFRTDMEEGEAVFSVPAITGDAVSASPVAFGIVLERRIIRLGKMPDELPFDCSLEYGIDHETIDAQFDCMNFRLGEFLSFSGGLEDARQLLDIAVSGTASFDRTHNGSLDYAVNLAGAAIANNALPSPAAGGSFQINAAGDEKRAHINTLRLSMPHAEGADGFVSGEISFSGSAGLEPFAPDGTLSLINFGLWGRETLNADILVSARDSEISARCETLSLGQVDLIGFNVLLRPSKNNLGFTVSALRLIDPEHFDNGRRGALLLKGSLDSEPRRMELNVRLDSFSVGDLAGMALPFIQNASLPVPLKGLLDGAFITTELYLNTDFVHWSYNAPRFVFNDGTGKGFEGRVSLTGTERRFELNGGRFVRGDDTLLLSGKADFTAAKNTNFLINAHYRNQVYFVEGAVLSGKSVNIQGSHGFNVNLAASGGKGYTGSLYADNLPVPFLGYPAFLSCAAQLRYDTAASWSVDLDQFELTGIASPAGPAQIRISGNADSQGVHLPLLYYRDTVGPLNGRADIFWPADYSGFTGTLEMGEAEERYHVAASFTDRRFNLAFSGSSVHLDRAFNKVKALANGDIRLSWDSINSFQTEFNLSSVKGKLFGQEFGARAYAVLDSGELVVNSLNFSFAGIEGTMPWLMMSGVKGAAEAKADIIGLAGGRPLEAGLSLEAGFRPIRSWFEMGEVLNSVAGNIHIERFSYGNEKQTQTFDIAFSRSDDVFSVAGGPRDMIRFQMDGEGSFYAGLSSPCPLRGTFIGSIQHNTINAHCGDLYVDMAELFAVVPENSDFFMTGGYVNASLDIRGSLTDPEFFGSARGTSLRIRVPGYLTQELRPIPFTITLEGNEMNFGPVPTTVGKGAGTVKGWFRFDRWIPDTFSLDIAVPRETPIPYGFDISGFVARGDAAGNLNVSMENTAFDISGDLYANNTEMGINYEEIANSRGGSPFSQSRTPFVVNVTISTGPVVEFIYPNSRIPILRANPDIGTKLHITADSLARQYSLVSDVKIRGGDIYYLERNFYIRSGTLSFRENELRFSPRLTARAEIRDHTDSGPVTISMIVDNAPLLSFAARFESSPMLSQMEILALLGQSTPDAPPDESATSIQRAFFNSGSEIATKLIMGRQLGMLEQQIRNFTRLDMFSVRTQVLQNALYQAFQAPVDRISGVGNYFDNTTVFGGKYIGQDMFVQGMVSLRYDANKAAFAVAPDIGIEMQNPLFGIRWDFTPTHPENWYVNDNSITLTWSRSF
ncbi:MAG: translocation/assembly module TamB domain-containing protein [Treponema sp.]|nr:translocation/assembly module TamB domain-containing protein [Treponema sp.]